MTREPCPGCPFAGCDRCEWQGGWFCQVCGDVAPAGEPVCEDCGQYEAAGQEAVDSE